MPPAKSEAERKAAKRAKDAKYYQRVKMDPSRLSKRREVCLRATNKYQSAKLADPLASAEFRNKRRTNLSKYYNRPYGRIKSYKERALKKGFEWSISDEFATWLFYLPCVYCRAKPTNEKLGGIDRRDSGRGYFPENVDPCCWPCNKKKGRMWKEHFLATLA